MPHEKSKSSGGGLFNGLSRMTHSKSRKQLAPEPSKWDGMVFPTKAEDYEMRAECGRGGEATVYQAICKSNQEMVAIKKIDLDDVGWGAHWEDAVNEARTMAMHHHPNLLPLLASFTDRNKLWIVAPYIEHGSVFNIMKYSHPNGLSEELIAIIVHETLKGLEYLHHHGMMHRDVKAGNILIDSDGQVYLADFGVAAPLEKRGGSWGDKPRNTFVGTPCWMAPEVMQESQYDFSADIWSLGITVLELANGHAPFAKYPPFKVVMMTVQNPPPSLNSEAGAKHKRFSQDLHDLVASCLQKDPAKRPTTRQLLEHRVFRHLPKDKDYMKKHLIKGLPNVIERVRQMREGVAGMSCEEAGEAQEASNEQYVKGLSAWNFDVKALKREAERMEPLMEEDEPQMMSGVSFTSSHSHSELLQRTTPSGSQSAPPSASQNHTVSTPAASATTSPLPSTSQAPSAAASPVVTPPHFGSWNAPHGAPVWASSAAGSVAGSGGSPPDTLRSEQPPAVAGSGSGTAGESSTREPSAAEDAGNVATPPAHPAHVIAPVVNIEQGAFHVAQAPPVSVPTVAPPVGPHGIPVSPPSNAASGPPSNPTSEAVEDDYAHATIGPAIAAHNTYMPPPHLPFAGLPFAGGKPATVEGGSLQASTTMQSLTMPAAGSMLTVPSTGVVPTLSSGEAALPPTEVNVAQHTRALEAAEVSAPPQQRIGRFSIKKGRGEVGPGATSDNGSAHTAMGDEGLHRVSQGTSVAPTDHHKAAGGESGGTAEAKSDDPQHHRSRSTKGGSRFTVTNASAPLQRASLSTSHLASEGGSLTVDAITAFDTDAHHAPVLPSVNTTELDTTTRSVHDAPVTSPAHTTSSTPGELDLTAAQAMAGGPLSAGQDAAALDAALAAGSAASSQHAGSAAAAKELRKKESRFKVLKVVENQKTGDVATPSARTSSETVPAGLSSTPASAHGGLAAPGVSADALGIINKKLQELMQANQMQHDAIKMLMSAVSECGKGKEAAICDLGRGPLLAVHLMGSEAHNNALLEENATLKAELEDLKRRNRSQNDKAKALHKENQLHKSQVQTLKDQIQHLEGTRSGPVAQLRTTPVAASDSRASSPSAPASAPLADPPGGASGSGAGPTTQTRPLPLDMTLVGEAATAPLLTDDGPWPAPTTFGTGTSSMSMSDLASVPGTPHGVNGTVMPNGGMRHSKSASRLPAASTSLTGLVNPFTGTVGTVGRGAPGGAGGGSSGPLPLGTHHRHHPNAHVTFADASGLSERSQGQATGHSGPLEGADAAADAANEPPKTVTSPLQPPDGPTHPPSGPNTAEGVIDVRQSTGAVHPSAGRSALCRASTGTGGAQQENGAGVRPQAPHAASRSGADTPQMWPQQPSSQCGPAAAQSEPAAVASSAQNAVSNHSS